MKQRANGFVASRVLKFNVGFLLNAGAGHSHITEFDVPPIRVSDDVDLTYLKGPLRLSRTKEGILVQGRLQVGLQDECYRCLDPVERHLTLDIEELYDYPTPKDTEFTIGDDAMLDLASLVRSEAIIADSRGTVCREDCKGLCPTCGTNWNHATCTCADEEIDPRMAKLRALLNP